jgi:hypothetical protein
MQFGQLTNCDLVAAKSLSGAAGWPFAVAAQQAESMRRIFPLV